MNVKKALVGSFPKNPKLGKVISWYNTGKINKEKLEKHISENIKKLFELAGNIKLEYTTNGLFRWDDIVDVTFGFISGTEKGPLQRFFDNNFYYRQPIIKEKINVKKREENSFLQDLEFSRKIKEEVSLPSKLKAVIPGPLTYYVLSDNRYYNSPIELMMDYASVVNSLSQELSSVVDAIEIHEPAIYTNNIKRDILEKLPEIYKSMLDNVKIEKHLITYFEINNLKRLDTLFSLPVDYFGIDVIENLKKLGRVYTYFSSRKVYLGMLNARNTKMERITTIIRVYNSVKRKGVSDVIIGNNTLFDFIPEVVVVKKLKLLKKLEKVEINE
ncbi:hypothetical protein SULI_07110 [Saccharolobus solfataricus]|nr:5-methyltetrahydropteroyltriglutamate--homocysteine methyltransferase [Saccharolobus solfataricus]AKA73712.1 hypothetical protein SULB_1431 [Saccharolobus solfataricus]AKA76409.1 hypothetical protein SULC_1429 [Saccharolobus solfataricus]AKA79102.1 hypothetical protein SULA_1430 [Saccharolobus solfataricus]AZF68183.1 hypothetical protein SULG_07110 [Saccharolobus solfataricus]AZF70803.1 hypothetical protein SULH_07110 [Saccharolobus solfataricus]